MPASEEPKVHAHLVLVRHGESTNNALGVFTGWRDIALTERGREQAVAAGRRLRATPLRFDAVFTSVLQRAVETAALLTAELAPPVPAPRALWRLNERHTGAMQGLTKSAAKRAFGSELARTYRRSWDTAPPPVAAGSADDPRGEPRYRELGDAAPRTEAMGDLAARVLPVWDDELRPLLAAGRSVLVVGHGMALRALARPVEGLAEPRLPDWKLASAAPRWYQLDATLRPLAILDLGVGDDAPDE
ncbi:MAG: 2,3-bisphosphoglycerate-dependent phosphoglycerate mutase [Planctomycetota bacterium]